MRELQAKIIETLKVQPQIDPKRRFAGQSTF